MRFLDGRLLELVRGRSRGFWLTVALGAGAGLATIFQAALLARVLDSVFLGGADLRGLAWPLGALVVAVVLRAVLAGSERAAAHASAAELVLGLRREALERIEALGPIELGRRRSGEVQAVLMDGLDDLHAWFADYLPQVVLSAVVPLGVAVVVLSRDALSAVVLLVTAPLIPLFMVLIGSLADAKAQRRVTALGRMSAYFLDVIQGLVTLKILGRAQDTLASVGRISGDYRTATMGVLRLALLSALALELLATLSTAVVAVEIGLRLLYGRVEFVDAFFVLLLAPEFYLPLRLLGQRFHSGSAGVAAADRLWSLLEEAVPGPARRGAVAMPRHSRLALDEVHVAYGDADGAPRPALNGVSMHLDPGETIALVGPSGAGKSTVARLLLRFLEADSGVLSADGIPAHRIAPERWRERLAWVPQQTHLFAGTVADNLRLGRPDAGIGELRTAARRARAEEFIDALPLGWDTIIGEGGAGLSAGQAQRLAIARALLRDAEIIVLDEPGAGLDALTLDELDRANAELLGARTALVIAHRLTTIRRADRVVVLESGCVIESGPPKELCVAGGAFNRLLSAHGVSW